MKHRILTFLSFSLGGILLLAIFLFGLSQTDGFQEKIKITLETEAKKEGIELDIVHMKGLTPFTWSIEHLSIKKGKESIYIEDVEVKIAPLSLLRKKLYVHLFSAKEIHLSFFTEENEVSLSPFLFPFDLQLKKFECKKIALTDLKTKKTLTFSLSGKGKVDKEGKEVQARFLVQEIPGFNSLNIDIASSEKKNRVKSEIHLKLSDPHHISSFFNLSFIPSLDVSLYSEGLLDAPLPFQVKARIDSLPNGEKPFFVDPISLKTQGTFSLNPKSPLLSVQSLEIKNQELELIGHFALSSDFTPLCADLSLSMKESSPLHEFFPFREDLALKVHLDKNSFLGTLYTPSLQWKNQIFEPANFQISATREKAHWRGSSQIRIEHPELCLKQSCQFLLKGKELDLLDFSFSLAELKIGGTGKLFIEDLSYQGSFFVCAEELRPFRLLFPLSEIDGKVGGSFSLKGKKDHLSFELSSLLKNIRYQNSLIESAQMEAQMEDLFFSPQGFLSCEAKNLFFRDILISTASFTSQPDQENKHSFSLDLNGDWKQELHVKSLGTWKKERDFWQLEAKSFEGSFFKQSFSLETSCLLEKNSNHLSLKPSLWKIGEGSLLAQFSLSKEHLDFTAESKHLPLGILGVLYPKMAFGGSSSFNAALSGAPNNLKGHFFATLEKGNFSQNSAKGSLQIHFNPSGAQVHSHLYATKNQFLDLTATIPLSYSFIPLSFQIDPIRPISSELTLQGAVENIFDFINTASHKASGWITTHLFLSGTLKEPSLLGSLKCEQASYENYFTGTELNKVEAEFSASQHTIELVSLKGFDEKEGTISAEGTLTLSPEKNFPFSLKIDLSSMHVVHSDLIDASLTGSLEISGNQIGAKAFGSLKADKATFKIFDELLYEIPSLPVSYINKPISLNLASLESLSPYPLELNLELSSEDSVFVEGKGLNSNWYGTVHVKGTSIHPLAKGSLTLKQGEFTFSGKTFTLKQGEISFFDKPTPGAYLKLSGELPLPSTTILAQMQGPLTSPNLTFQSIPALPTSSILSLILFDKDISEISALQALQLAQTIMSLSGNGSPGVLDSIRKKIGVDRLNIVGKDGTDEISVQIGWYLNHGITLSLSQSATSSDVTVEVDLKNGFLFQAETQNQEEGKFSLKWNRNY